MPVNPAQISNPYIPGPLNGGGEEEDVIARLQREYAEEQGNPNLQMTRSIARQATQPGQDQGALMRALDAAQRAVPMSEWKPAPEPLPVSRRDHVRTVLASRERQLRALEAYASDPGNPVTQESVESVRQRIEAESANALKNSTLPSPVAMYEQMVDAEDPEVARARAKENLLTIPGFKREWSSFVSFDENNAPVYPKWMEEPMQRAMERAMGVEEVDTSREDKARTDAFSFEDKRLRALEPDAKTFESEEAYQTAYAKWQGEMRANFVRNKPQAAAYLPTFAEEQGFAPPAAPAAAPAPAAGPAAPTHQFNAEEAEQMRARLDLNGISSFVAQSPDEVKSLVESGELQPGGVVVVNTPDGTFGYKMQADGTFTIVSRLNSGKL